MTEQSKRDAAVAVITEAFNTAHDPAPVEHPEFEKHRRHDGHIAYGGCDLCQGDVAKLAPHIADALAVAGLLIPSTSDRSMVDTIRQVLHDMRHGCTEEPAGHQRLAEEIARRLTAQQPAAPDTPDEVVGTMADALKDLKINLGENTIDAIRHGQEHVRLSGGERHNIAATALLFAFQSPRWRRLAREAHDSRERLLAVDALHKPVPMYGECGHTSEQHQDLGIEIVEAPEIGETCEAARGADICLACCTDRHSDFGQTQQCADYHEPPCWPCPTATAAGLPIPVQEGGQRG